MASILLANDALRALVETGIADAELEVLIDGADAEIQGIAGPHSADGSEVSLERTDVLRGNRQKILLPVMAESVGNVREWKWREGPDSAVTVTDYYLDRGLYLWKKNLSSWLSDVEVTFSPVDDIARRRTALIELVKLDVQSTGLKTEQEGGHSYTAEDRNARREEILSSLAPVRI